MTKDKATYEILSLFSGGGFLDLGFYHNGFQVKEAVEIQPQFINSYNKAIQKHFELSTNEYLKNEIVQHTNIKSPIDISLLSNQEEIKNRNHSVRGIIGGPPCQDFSIGGKNRGINGNRGKLIDSYFNMIKLIRPDFILFENVKGLCRSKKHKPAYQNFLIELQKLGYSLWDTVLNSLEYGVPQDRERVIVVGFKQEIIEKLSKKGFVNSKNDDLLKNSEEDNFVFRWPKVEIASPKKNFNWPKKIKFKADIPPINKEELKSVKHLQVFHAFRGLTKETPNQNEHFTPKSSKIKYIEEGDTNRKSLKRLHRYRYSPTVAYGNNEVHLHPYLPRRLTVREALRLQSVPDSYQLPKEVPLTHKFKLIGNGVPVKFAEVLAKEVKKTLDRYSLCL